MDFFESDQICHFNRNKTRKATLNSMQTLSPCQITCRRGVWLQTTSCRIFGVLASCNLQPKYTCCDILVSMWSATNSLQTTFGEMSHNYYYIIGTSAVGCKVLELWKSLYINRRDSKQSGAREHFTLVSARSNQNRPLYALIFAR